jgi:hypothetical protein
MSLSRSAPADQPNEDARLNELLQQFREAEDYDTPPGLAGGRDSRGRFAPGNLGGPGNPYNRRVAELRRILLEEVSDDAMRVIIQVLLFKAQTGDLAAIKLVLQYVLGKPTPAPDPDAIERQPEQETPRQVDTEPKRHTSKCPQRERSRQQTGSTAQSTSAPRDPATDANGGNGDPLSDAIGTDGEPPIGTAMRNQRLVE